VGVPLSDHVIVTVPRQVIDKDTMSKARDTEVAAPPQNAFDCIEINRAVVDVSTTVNYAAASTLVEDFLFNFGSYPRLAHSHSIVPGGFDVMS
jgi:hypothetical protein